VVQRDDGVQWFRPRGQYPQPRPEDLPPGQRQVQFPPAQRGEAVGQRQVHQHQLELRVLGAQRVDPALQPGG
jgi:hypothetical protein